MAWVRGWGREGTGDIPNKHQEPELSFPTPPQALFSSSVVPSEGMDDAGTRERGGEEPVRMQILRLLTQRSGPADMGLIPGKLHITGGSRQLVPGVCVEK